MHESTYPINKVVEVPIFEMRQGVLSGNIGPFNIFAVLFFNFQACKQVTETIKMCDRYPKKGASAFLCVMTQYTGYF